eukprot:gene17295-21143_t
MLSSRVTTNSTRPSAKAASVLALSNSWSPVSNFTICAVTVVTLAKGLAVMLADRPAAITTIIVSPIARLIASNIAIKAAIVEEDEFETVGTRALLNFGHTLGHAIEAAAGYGKMLHGEAISLGLRAAAWLSMTLAGLPRSDYD